MRNAWQLIPGDGADDQRRRSDFKPLVAQNVAEVLWHKTQQTRISGGWLAALQARVSGLGEIMWWILGYGDQAEVLAAARSSAHMVAQRAKNLGRNV